MPDPEESRNEANDPAELEPARSTSGSIPVVAVSGNVELDEALRFHFHQHLVKVEQLVTGAGRRAVRGGGLPAWLRETPGENRWATALIWLVAIALQLAIPERLSVRPNWVLPALEFVLLAIVIIANPRRIDRDEIWLRYTSIAIVAVASVANAWSAVRLVREIVVGPGESASSLLLHGAAIWLTNIIIFALWYWELDRGGPVARSKATHTFPDFMYPQMQAPDLAPEHWEPAFLDYLYVSFTNATAFSPTDTMPLSRWAKMLMMAQACVSLATVALVIARAVNILG
jgi:uncharacterized membrane protein